MKPGTNSASISQQVTLREPFSYFEDMYDLVIWGQGMFHIALITKPTKLRSIYDERDIFMHMYLEYDFDLPWEKEDAYYYINLATGLSDLDISCRLTKYEFFLKELRVRFKEWQTRFSSSLTTK